MNDSLNQEQINYENQRAALSQRPNFHSQTLTKLQPMTALQRKAITEAVSILENLESHPFHAENYSDPNQLLAAAKKQRDGVYNAAGKIGNACAWLRAVLGE